MTAEGGQNRGEELKAARETAEETSASQSASGADGSKQESGSAFERRLSQIEGDVAALKSSVSEANDAIKIMPIIWRRRSGG